MNEIEKMYETVGLHKRSYIAVKFNDKIFTAEKQLELIKLLAIRFNSDYMSYWHNEIKDVWIFRLHDLTELSSEEPCIYEGRNKDFTEALCNLINDLWQDLTEEERKQIKEVLE